MSARPTHPGTEEAKVQESWNYLASRGPEAAGFFASQGFTPPGLTPLVSPAEWWSRQDWNKVHEAFGSPEAFGDLVISWAEGLKKQSGPLLGIQSLTLLGGTDKSGRAEDLRLEFFPGEVVCLVGPTGAGKSRLLADIECLAQGDTPSHRQILLNGSVPDEKTRFSIEHRLVAQISQNMNFVMDLGVEEFLRLHAQSRGMQEDSADIAAQVLHEAVSLAGEPFTASTPLTQLSGGQSRALMIADAAFLSPKPIVLIDEIENAGVDRRKALSLFTRQGKLVFLSTHDPLLALSGQRRLVIRHGGIHRVLETLPEERHLLARLATQDAELAGLRNRLRSGETLTL